MADQPTTPSGSREEHDPDETPTSGAPIPPPAPAEPYAEPYAVPERPARLRGRAVLAGAATALTLGGGLVGFLIGHTTAGDDRPDLRPASFSDRGPGPQPGEHRQGPPAFGDRDGGPGSGP